MKLRLLPLALAAAAVVPASASATPHWSAPTEVIPSPGAEVFGNSAPEALVAGGRSLVAAGSAERALLARGNAANVFDTPINVATAPSGSVGLDAATAPDGSVAVAWAASGSGHVSLVSPGGSVLGQADLPGAGVNAIGVGIASDGSTIVAYRTKESKNSYSLRVATAAPGSATFGEPVSLETTAATDSIDVATGPDGAAAIAYRKLVGKYRARVAVRPAGAAAFEPGQPMTTNGDLDDFTPQVAFDGDGSLVAAWGNPAGAQYALRPAGAGASFGAGVALGAGAAFSVDLAATPSGAAAVAIAGDGRVRAAVQSGPGGAFGEPAQVGESYVSQITATAAVTTQPSGPTTVVYGNPVDGAVHAADLGGSDQIIGYGGKDAQTPVSVDSGSDRTVATWTTGTGDVVAATRSESAKPATPADLGPKPAGRDTRPPRLRYASGTKRFAVTSKTKTLKLKVRCDEKCKLFVTGSLRTQLSAKARRKIAPLPAVKTKKFAAGTQTVTLKFGGLAQKDLRDALRRGRGGQLFLVVEAYDASGNGARTRVQLTVKPATKKSRR